MTRTFETYEAALGFFDEFREQNELKFAEFYARYRAAEERYRQESGFDRQAEELRRKDALPGTTPFELPLPDEVVKRLQDNAAKDVELVCPVEAYWLGNKVCLNVDYGFGHLMPKLSTNEDESEGSHSIEAAAQKAKELFTETYCGIKLVPVFYTVVDHRRPPLGDIVKILLYTLVPARLGFLKTAKAVLGMAMEFAKAERHLTDEELISLEKSYRHLYH